jgi:isopentenyl phosphate kinase
MNLVFIKLGGSLITDKNKPFSEDLKIIKRLASEIHKARQKTNMLFIVGHGGGSYPHVPAKKFKTAQGVLGKESYQGIAEVQDAAARLNRIVVHELINAGENTVSFSPSSFMIAKDGEIKKAFLDPLLRLLDFGMLPVVYGDVLLDLKMGCSIASTEKILNFLAFKLKDKFKVKRVIHCGKTNGVYDRKGKTITKINTKNFGKVRAEIGSSYGIDVTGGMLHKVEESLVLAKVGIPSVIINGARKGELLKVLLGELHKGTEVL